MTPIGNPVALGMMAVLLVACARTTPAAQPAATATPVTQTPTPVPSPTATPAPIPTIPAWSPYQPDSAAGWCWQQVIGQVDHLNDVFFWNAETGWAVGEQGTILHTDDGGTNWRRQSGPITATLQQVEFVDSRNGWVLGTSRDSSSYGVILLRTGDGGTSWIEQPVPSHDDDYVYSLHMAWPDAHTGWLTVEEHVFQTSDGGQTWQERTPPDPVYRWDTLISVDGQHAWVAADHTDTIARTDDSGATWVIHPITATQLANRFFMDDLEFVDAQNGWATSRDAIIHTVDGGQTWEVQLTSDQGNGGPFAEAVFEDARAGWVWNDGGSLWSTTDGGLTWERGSIPPDRQAVAFGDDQRAWAVGRWTEIERSTIAHTRDRGATWEMQDTHVETPASAYVAAARLTALAAQRDAPWEGLLPLLLPGPCRYPRYSWLLATLHNLGWVEGVHWEEPLLPASAGYQDMSDTFQRLDVDVDEDGEDEVIILGSGCDGELVASVLDWDGARWQVAWVLHPFTRYNSDIRARVDDVDDDGRLDLLVETLTHPGSGTGVLVQQWNVYLVRCTHLSCQTVWTEDIGYAGRSFSLQYITYDWQGSGYRFTRPDGVTPAITMQTYGVWFRQTPITTDTVTATLTVLTSTQSVYLWNGAVYTPTDHTTLTPAYTLDMHPFTGTLLGDVYAVHGWEGNAGGLWQTLSIYVGDEVTPTRVFTTPFTAAPAAGVWLQDADGDGQLEVMDCDTDFVLTYDLRFTEQLSTLPECVTYRWDPSARKFLEFR